MVLDNLIQARKAQDLIPVDPNFLLNERNYDLVNLSDWESNIVYAPSM